MSSPTTVPAQRPSLEHADESFWLARLDANLPRATLVPDRRRNTTVERRYEAVAFELDAACVAALKSLDPVTGVSDLALCTSLVAALLSKYHREDELVVGLHWSGRGSAGGPRPALLNCSADATADTLIEEVGGEVARVLAHPADALAYLPHALGVAYSPHRCPFYDLAIHVGAAGTDLDLRAHPVDAAFVFNVEAGRINGRLQFAHELFDRPRIDSVVAHLLHLARDLATAPREPLHTHSVLSPEEREQLLAAFNRRSANYPLQRTMHSLFEEQCRRTPDAVAVVHRDVTLSYDELNRRANRLANTLLEVGVSKGAFVCILLERGCDFVVAMLASFKAGAAYVPLDPTYPHERIQYMLNDSAAAVLVSNRELLARFDPVVAGASELQTVIALDADATQPVPGAARALIDAPRLAAARATDPGLDLKGCDRAYMIYTSGSTGRPKGAICRHDGALNHLFGELDGVGVRSAFSFLQTAASSSDISVWQFVAPLLHGGSTVVADYDVVVDPDALFALIREHKLSVAEPVPVVLRALIDHIEALPASARALPDLRCMMVTGEALPAELVDRWLALYPAIPIANTYGPTETSDDVTLSVLREPIGTRYAVAPIGMPLPNVRLFVLDRNLQPVPIGVPGEICVGGLAVGEGYWRQPDKTRSAFVPCPFDAIAPGPMYRTGDLGRWLPDGQIEFLGRVDQQVKVRGFRVEPGEIEAAMTQHAAVQDAAVVVAAEGPGTGRLIGYYTLRKGQSLSPAQLRAHLKSLLAEHMVPSSLTALSILPRTPLGKLDRKALAAAQERPAEHDHGQAPRTATERAVAGIWSAVTGAQAIGIGDNFFEIGGDSISSIQVTAQLRKAGFRLAPRDVFQRPTLGALAEYLDQNRSLQASAPTATMPLPWDVDGLRQRLTEAFPSLQDAYPLSATQRGIYYQGLLLPKSSGAYIEQVTFDVAGTLDPLRFEAAWQHVIDSTDMLRAAVIRRGGQQPSQALLAAAPFALDLLDLSTKSDAEQASAIDALVLSERVRGFDLKSPPLMRVVLVKRSPGRSRVVWTYHHLILDGWSEPLVLAAVFRAYAALTASRQPEPASVARYRDFVAWTEAQDLTAAEAYWRAALAGFDTPAVVVDRSPGVTPAAAGEILHGWCDIVLSPADTQRLEHSARHAGVTLATVIHGAWALLVHRATGLADVVVGSVASGRGCDVPGIDTLAGLVVVTQPLRSRPSSDSTVVAWLRLLQMQMAEMREHEHTPLAQIQQWSEVPAARRPLFDSIVVVGNYAGSDLSACAQGVVEISDVASYTQPQYALTLFIVTGASLRIRLVYEKKRYAAATAKGLLDEYAQVLNAIAENPGQRVSSLTARI
ncbi:MAG TPA: amino acid adenylation domain-containing protein [Burkholderiaceae bacterium]|nr:amino acid adenylation domain-containing protein [Burkholderiaceae bacterium]